VIDCVFCREAGGEVLWKDDLCRVVLAPEPDYPGFCRVILNRHVREMTDLAGSERQRLMTVVFAAEAALRAILQPDKINLASLGNQVPHVHWHVIPRFADDPHFPNPVWSPVLRGPAHPPPTGLAQSLSAAVASRLEGTSS
jgi:diadenosine tetraphosphate (Ap4A) HIT family hydrolase